MTEIEAMSNAVRLAYSDAANEVRREARWQQETYRGNGTPDSVDRLLMVERILRDRAENITPKPFYMLEMVGVGLADIAGVFETAEEAEKHARELDAKSDWYHEWNIREIYLGKVYEPYYLSLHWPGRKNEKGVREVPIKYFKEGDPR